MTEAKIEIPIVKVEIAPNTRPAGDEEIPAYRISGTVELKFGVNAEYDNPRDEDLEEIRQEMQRSFEEYILDTAALILKKWGEGLFPLSNRLTDLFNPEELMPPSTA